MADIIPYRSTRRLRGALRLGDVTATANAAGDYIGYAKAIYQALQGDVAGAGYSAAIVAAGPVAAIGNAIATYFNAPGKVDHEKISAFSDMLVNNLGFGKVLFGRVYSFLTPDGSILIPSGGDAILAVARAIIGGDSSDHVLQLFKAWLDTGKPYKGGMTVVVPPKALAPAMYSAPAASPAPTPAPTYTAPTPTPAPAPTPTPTPSPSPSPSYTAPASPIYTASPVYAATAPPVAPAVASQTASIVAQLLNQGATTNQAYVSALQMLAARGVAPTPAVQAHVTQSVQNAAPQMASTMWIVVGVAALLGLGLLIRGSE